MLILNFPHESLLSFELSLLNPWKLGFLSLESVWGFFAPGLSGLGSLHRVDWFLLQIKSWSILKSVVVTSHSIIVSILVDCFSNRFIQVYEVSTSFHVLPGTGRKSLLQRSITSHGLDSFIVHDFYPGLEGGILYKFIVDPLSILHQMVIVWELDVIIIKLAGLS